jgi:hypothetical protein
MVDGDKVGRAEMVRGLGGDGGRESNLAGGWIWTLGNRKRLGENFMPDWMMDSVKALARWRDRISRLRCLFGGDRRSCLLVSTDWEYGGEQVTRKW